MKISRNFKYKISINDALDKLYELLEMFNATDISHENDELSILFNCKSLTFKVSGDITLKESGFSVTVNLPIAAMAFKSKVERAIDKKFKV